MSASGECPLVNDVDNDFALVDFEVLFRWVDDLLGDLLPIKLFSTCFGG